MSKLLTPYKLKKPGNSKLFCRLAHGSQPPISRGAVSDDVIKRYQELTQGEWGALYRKGSHLLKKDQPVYYQTHHPENLYI